MSGPLITPKTDSRFASDDGVMMATMSERPVDAAEIEMLSDAGGYTIIVSVLDDPSREITLAGVESFGADPAYCFGLRTDQAIALGEALLRAGIRKQVIEQLHGVAFAVDMPERPLA
jgi:hypothetical protein